MQGGVEVLAKKGLLRSNIQDFVQEVPVRQMAQGTPFSVSAAAHPLKELGGGNGEYEIFRPGGQLRAKVGLRPADHALGASVWHSARLQILTGRAFQSFQESLNKENTLNQN